MVICYRDGVADDELQIVKDHEITQIKAAFGTLGIDE